MVRLFRGTCEAVRAMHIYRASVSSNKTTASHSQAPSGSASTSNQNGQHGDDDHEDQMLPQPEGDAEGGYSYDGVSVPLITRRREAEGDVVYDGDAELDRIRSEEPPQEDGKTETVPYAHRDIKPG